MNNMPSITYDKNNRTLVLTGVWNLASLAELQNQWGALNEKTAQIKSIDGQALTQMDTAGAWLLQSILQQTKKANITGLNVESEQLLDLVQKYPIHTEDKPKNKPNLLAQIGMASVDFFQRMLAWLSFIGELFITTLKSLLNPKTIRFKYFFKVIESNGFNALPIVGFLAFLIGVVLTYQTGLQLLQYGANIFIIGLLGIATFREFAPLITAIIIAGRTGSAFTAQIGLMKSNEEIDALRTMGFSPMVMLVLPRFFGLLIALPLLTVWADIFGIFGGMVMSKSILNISFTSFISQFPTNVTLTSFLIGIIKAPVFAMIIAAVGCYHGFKVTGSSESIGKQTTKSVVMSIFIIIMADAAFSIVLSWLNI